MSIAIRVALILIAIVSVLIGAMYYARIGLIYFFDQTEALPTDLPRTALRNIPAYGDDPELAVWVTTPREGKPVVIYFMGQSGSLAIEKPRLLRLSEAGFGIAAMAYRGGGGQEGKPSAETLYRDALRVFAGLDSLFGREIRDVDRVIWGYSLGTGLAARLAEEQEELAVVLEAPFIDLCAIKSGLLAIVPGCLFYSGQDLDTLGRIAGIGAPLLILHGARDDRIPVRQAEQLFEAAEEPKFIEIYEDGTHENLDRIGAAEDAITFIETLRGIR